MNRLFVYAWLLCSSWMLLPQIISSISDTISRDTPLSGSQTIVSQNGEFELGFFAPNGTQNDYYIGIWYKAAPNRPLIWVANRASPVSSPQSSQFRISQQGNLILLNQHNAQVWASSSSGQGTSNASAALVATLLDTGNLVLRSGAAGTDGVVLWQSFDEPTDTWLPGQKIGWSDQKVLKGLTSWRNLRDPSPGSYYFGLDPDGKDELVQMWNRSVVYWRSGEWNGEIFSLVPEMTRNAVFNYVYNTTEKTLYYYLKDTSIVTRFVAERSGQGMQYAWLNRSSQWMSVWLQPTALCDIYSYCGVFSICDQSGGGAACKCLMGYEPTSLDEWNGNDHTSGCRPRSAAAGCAGSVNGDANGRGGGVKVGFLAMPQVKPPLNPISPLIKVNNTAECEAACLNDCSCAAYAFDKGRCSTWLGNLTGIQQLRSGDNTAVVLHLRRVGTDPPPRQGSGSASGSGSNAGKIVGISIAAAVGVLLLIALCVFVVLYRNRSRDFKGVMDGSLLQFRYDSLQRATNNFSDRLGGGGFGSVFRGFLPPPNSTPIAVKKLEGLRQGEKQFRTEVRTVGTIQHVNVVKLLGFCSEGDHRLLVYNYLPNGSLDQHLFRGGDEEDPKSTLDWKTRYQVALGVARGLAYLHDKCIECIIHCDIKPENILLDEEFCPKVADLGMAKLVGREFSRVLTTMRGTMGYLAPEWLSGEPITPKADVYAFGMMLFEIISGKRNVLLSEEGDFFFFPIWAAKRITGGESMSVVDEKVMGEVDVEELNRACKVACWCIQDGEAHRPSMSLVVQVLEGVLDLSVPPVPKGLQHLIDAEEVSHFFSES